jgi:hypothetical protein
MLMVVCALLSRQQKTPTIRQQLMQAVNSSKTTDSLYLCLVAIKNPSPLITSYIGTLEALKAKHNANPYYKIKYVNDSETDLTLAVTAEPHNMEIRFMRFSVEAHIPAFLFDSKHMYTDREEIITDIQKKNYSPADKQMVITIINFLLGTNSCTLAENTYLTKQLSILQ